MQLSIQEMSSSLQLSGWPLYLLAESIAALGSYKAFQILIWDYKVPSGSEVSPVCVSQLCS